MKLGLSTSVANIKKIEMLGFDYLEGNLAELAAESEESYAKLLEEVKTSSIKPECFSVMIPGGIMLVGEQTDSEKLEQHLDSAYKRASQIGAEILVWGSGYSRKYPEGFSKERAFEQLVAAGRLMGKYAAKYGLTVVIEPLNSNETNLINKVSEGAQLANAIAHENVCLLADLYHVKNSGEGIEYIEKYLPLIKHIHIADATSSDVKVREYPDEEDKYETSHFIDYLKKIGYDGRMTLECCNRDNAEQQILNAYKAMRKWMA